MFKAIQPLPSSVATIPKLVTDNGFTVEAVAAAIESVASDAMASTIAQTRRTFMVTHLPSTASLAGNGLARNSDRPD
jgi:hypothetical protein